MKTVHQDGMIIEFDCEAVMRDGTIIRYDIYRPGKEGQYPCITTYGPYSKGMHFSQGYSLFWHDIKEKYPEILKGTSGKYMNWETVDPEKWVPEGYAIAKIDSRGCGRSEGVIDNWTIQEAEDYAECIEKIASLPWCDGNIAGLGISYYAIMQWAVAAQRPPHLKAIIPFEGACDLYREFARHGGIGSDFVNAWYPLQVAAVQHGLGKYGQIGKISDDYLSGPKTLSKKALIKNRRNYFEEIEENELIDADVYQRRLIDLSKIEIPVLSCGNWGGNALHLRGNTEGYLAIPSKEKYLEIHGLEHFTEFYTDYGRTMQKDFLDHYLKGKDTWNRAPVHLRLRNVDGSFTDRDEQEWPIARTQWTKYYLHEDGSLSTDESDDFRFSFKADSEWINFFTEPLTEELEITGPAAASLFISSSTKDADIFLTIRVLDPNGNDVTFVAANDPHGVIATGWLRASHRKMDEEKSLPYRPYHTHDELQPLKKGEKVQMNIEIWPTSIIIPKGYRLGVNIGGRDFRFTAPNLTSKVDISHYLKNPKLMIGMFRALPMDQLFRILTHEKVWAGNAMYTHHMDMKRKAFSGTTTVYSEAGNRPYLLLPVIPGKKA